MEKYLVTAALPYANGPIHVGHVAGAYLPADVYVRFLRLRKKDVVFICGTDEHGVPITLAAEKRKIPCRDFVREIHDQMEKTFLSLGISFDNFSGTARPVHYETATGFFQALNEKGCFERKSTHQLYCESCLRFLPDRYVEGICPRCRKEGARGDQCEKCGSDLDPVELISPSCKICGQTPVLKETSHWFLKLSSFAPRLRDWIESKQGVWKDNVIRFCLGLLNEGLPDRAITRDMEWGVPVPFPEGRGKVIYVWFEAPIGYISSTKEWAARIGDPDRWKYYWQDPDTRLVHFIGKDNIVFHSIMWPAVLMGCGGVVLPWQIPANEFLNLEGEKVSTSRGYAIWVHEFLESFSADSLRYYTASIAPETKDSDFSLREFQAAHNNELADILGNFVNRTVAFVQRYFDGKIPDAHSRNPESLAMVERIRTAATGLSASFGSFELRKSVAQFMNLARDANKYFTDQAPWISRKENPARCALSLHTCLMVIRALSVLGSPLIPFSCRQMGSLFPSSCAAEWDRLDAPLPAGERINSPGILFVKIEDAIIEKWSEKLRSLK